MLKLKVFVKEVKDKNGVAFLTYKVRNGDNKWVDLKFRKEVKELPVNNCYIECEKEDVSVDTTGQYDCVWVKAIKNILPREQFNVEDYFK